MTMLKKFAMIATASSLAMMLGGCGDEASQKTYLPVPFEKHDRCHLCGMVIAHYEGPKAEVIIKGAEDTPLKFCAGRDAFTYALQPENKRRLLAFYIHDLAKTDWETPDDKYLIAADQAMYVYGHRREGVMGDEPAAFSDKAAAEAFIKEWGGKIYQYKDITLELLD